MLAAVPPTLLMAVALPSAFGTGALQFAGAYFVVQLWALAVQGWGLWPDRANRIAWLRYLPLAALAPTILVVGAFFDGRARVAVWAVVALFDVGAALLANRRSASGTTNWRIDPVHFAERHALFVIISLGEVLVAAGASAALAAGEDLTLTVGVGLVAAEVEPDGQELRRPRHRGQEPSLRQRPSCRGRGGGERRGHCVAAGVAGGEHGDDVVSEGRLDSGDVDDGEPVEGRGVVGRVVGKGALDHGQVGAAGGGDPGQPHRRNPRARSPSDSSMRSISFHLAVRSPRVIEPTFTPFDPQPTAR